MAANEIVQIENPEWECIWERHNSCYPNQDRTVKLLKCKFQERAKKKVPAAKPNCPPYVIFTYAFTGKLLRPLMAQKVGQILKAI